MYTPRFKVGDVIFSDKRDTAIKIIGIEEYAREQLVYKYRTILNGWFTFSADARLVDTAYRPLEVFDVL